jgi:hypothetical protein
VSSLAGNPGIGNPVGAPVDVVGLSNVAAIAAGRDHTCALVSDGSVHCWGSNFFGQLGDGSTISRIAPVAVAGLTNVIAIAAGQVHSCAITSAGGLLCWGGNNQGQLGDGTLALRVTPLTIFPSGVRMVAAGVDRTCIVTDAGAVRCWGSNAFLQLGNSAPGGAVTGLNGSVTKLVAGAGHTCVVIDERRVKCWGSDVYGELGDNRTASFSGVPVNVLGLEDGVLSLAAGGGHTCAVLSSGAVRCWGADLAGQLGDGHAMFIAPPVSVVVPDRPPVIEFHNAILDHYFLTAGAAEAQAIDRGGAGPGWSRTGLTFKSGGDVPVCRFHGSALPPGPNSHFFAFDGSECEGLRDIDILPGDPRRGSVKSWHFEGFAFFITIPTITGCPAFTMPVYRAYNNGSMRGVDSNHRLTTDAAVIRAMVARGWVDEGVVMCAPK